MASFKLVLDKYKKSDGKQTIQLRITVNRRAIPRSTGYSVKAKDWDAANQRVKPTHKNCVEINDALSKKIEAAEREFAERDRKGMSTDSAEIARATFASHDFYAFAQKRIDAMTGPTEIGTFRRYTSWLKGLKEYAPTLTFSQITPEFIEGYRRHLKSKKQAYNTIVGRLSSFRATVNAIPAGLRPRAFDEVTVGTFRAAENKEALSIEEITALWNYEPKSERAAITRDTFLFSYYAAGMRIGDVIRLRWADVKDNRITYQEGKKKHLNKAKLYIHLNSYARELIERQPKTSEYIFGDIKSTTPEGIAMETISRESVINNYLFKIRVDLDIKKHITAKVARDTFAQIANKRSGRDIYGISKAMGHTSIKTTEIYLGNDQSGIDDLLSKTYGK